MSVEQIKHLIFTRTEDLLEGEQRLPLKTIHVNKCPVVVPLKTLTAENISRLKIDLKQCERHLEAILEAIKVDQSLSERIQNAFYQVYSEASGDPDQDLYSGGFFSSADKERMTQIRATAESELGDLDFQFDDERLSEMLFRYRCRNYPDTLLLAEIELWNQFRIKRMTEAQGDASIKLAEYQQELSKLRLDDAGADRIQLLDQLEAYPGIIGLA